MEIAGKSVNRKSSAKKTPEHSRVAQAKEKTKLRPFAAALAYAPTLARSHALARAFEEK